MIAIGRYLSLFISLSGLTLSLGGRFSEKDIDKFLDYIFRLHNAVRLKHDVPKLERTYEMDVIASQKLNEWLNYIMEDDDPIGMNVSWMYYNNATQLDIAEAIHLFSLSYEQGNFYNYELIPTNNNAADFTQVVWQNTTQIGITFMCENIRYLVVAVYYPRGNIEETYTLNVKRPINTLPVSDPDIAGLIYQTEKEKFLDNILELHNEARTNHGVPLLRRDVRMDELANYILLSLVNIGTEYGVNWLGNKYFQNTKLGDKTAALQVFSKWYKGEKIYNYRKGFTKYKADAFSQIVWQSTREIGIGIQERIGGGYEVIVLYRPRGNVPGEYTSNVFMPRRMEQGQSSGNN